MSWGPDRIDVDDRVLVRPGRRAGVVVEILEVGTARFVVLLDSGERLVVEWLLIDADPAHALARRIKRTNQVREAEGPVLSWDAHPGVDAANTALRARRVR